MITTFAPLPPYLVNRDLKRDIRYICPGCAENVRGVEVERLLGNKSHLYMIHGYQMDMECVIDVLTGWTPKPAPKLPIQLALPLFEAA